MYTMHEIGEKTGLSYETLKFYCRKGIIPDNKRLHSNYRIFDDDDLAWIKSVINLRKCGMSIAQIRDYIQLCEDGQKTIDQRVMLLEDLKTNMNAQIKKLEDSIAYVDHWLNFFEDVQSGKTPYYSHLSKKSE